MVRIIIGFVFSVVLFNLQAQDEKKFQNGVWGASLERSDGHSIVFDFEVRQAGPKKVLFLRNAAESLKVDDIRVQGASVWIRLPFFCSRIRAAFKGNDRLEGIW